MDIDNGQQAIFSLVRFEIRVIISPSSQYLVVTNYSLCVEMIDLSPRNSNIKNVKKNNNKLFNIVKLSYVYDFPLIFTVFPKRFKVLQDVKNDVLYVK